MKDKHLQLQRKYGLAKNTFVELYFFLMNTYTFFMTYIYRLQTIQAGAQVYDSYGQKCNHRFLLNYGFAIENNTEIDGYCPNEVSLELSPIYYDMLPDEDKATQSRLLQLAKVEFWCRDSTAAAMIAVDALSLSSSNKSDTLKLVDPSAFSKRIRVSVSNNENTKAMMSMLRVIVANGEELSIITCGGLYMYRTCKDVRFAISTRNERCALILLLQIVEKALSAYPTTLEEDNLALQSEDFLPQFSNARNATIQVRGEKEVLHHYKNLAETALSVITLPEKEFEASIQVSTSTCDETLSIHFMTFVFLTRLCKNRPTTVLCITVLMC